MVLYELVFYKFNRYYCCLLIFLTYWKQEIKHAPAFDYMTGTKGKPLNGVV